MRAARRVLLHAMAPVVGAVVGLLGSFAHAVVLARLPVGLVCALLLSGATFVAAGLAVRSRTGAAAAVLGWLLPVLLLSAPRPEGDLVVAGNASGYAWLLGGTVVAGLCVAWPYAGTAGRRPAVRLS